jgi:hypothetical protein
MDFFLLRKKLEELRAKPGMDPELMEFLSQWLKFQYEMFVELRPKIYVQPGEGSWDREMPEPIRLDNTI